MTQSEETPFWKRQVSWKSIGISAVIIALLITVPTFSWNFVINADDRLKRDEETVMNLFIEVGDLVINTQRKMGWHRW